MHHGWTVILPIAGFGAAMITAFYMFRLIFLTFFGKPANKKINSHIEPNLGLKRSFEEDRYHSFK